MAPLDGTRGLAPKAFLARQRALVASRPWKASILAGFGGFAAILALATLSAQLGTILLIAPFGASCVLVFALPQSPLAQPRNVIGGHLISTIAGLSVFWLLGSNPFALALGVGLAIVCMSLTETLHPPAGADPIVVIIGAASWRFLLAPVLVGTISIVLVAAAFHRFVTRKPYPVRAQGISVLSLSRRPTNRKGSDRA